MKNILLTIAMTFGGSLAFAADATADNSQDATLPTAQCMPCPKAMQCDGEAWMNIETITIEAANGDPIAQYAIAYITDNGIGDTEKDPAKAQELYRQSLPGLQKAAEAGNPIACRALCRMYAEGKGVDKDEAKAAEFMQKCKESCKMHGGMKGWHKHHGHHGRPCCPKMNDKPADSSVESKSNQ